MKHKDYDSISKLVDNMRKPRESDETSLQEELNKLSANLQIMFNYGWPYQDVLVNTEGEPSGIPIDLAEIVLLVCEFAARHNIDLVDALEQVA